MITSEQLISIVIPCYNQARFLGETIESVLRQTYSHFEIIVVDDGSTDDTSEVAARYAGVRCVRQKNQGQAAARNAGLRASDGAYVVFLDSDDRLLPRALEIGAEQLNNHPECAFTVGRCQVIDSHGSPTSTESRPAPPKDHYVELLKDNFIWMPAMVMHRRDALDSVGGFRTCLSIKGAEDYDLYLRLTRERSICRHTVVVAEYRSHDSSTSSNPARMLTATLAVHRAQKDYVRGNERHERAYRHGRKFWRARYGEPLVEKVRGHARTSGEWKQALRGMLLLLQHYPGGFFTHGARRTRCVTSNLLSRLTFESGAPAGRRERNPHYLPAEANSVLKRRSHDFS